jgi:hypothetical protein
MRIWTVAAAILVPLLAACVIGHDHGSTNQPPPANTAPLTVVIDTNQTMSQKGGQGVGVFVQYTSGGHWHVWWTCDTSLSGLPCDFAVRMTGTSIANAITQFDPAETGDALATSTPEELDVTAHTTTGIDAIDFDAAPGADLKVDLSVSGLRDGAFFFFVQNGQIDGNFPPSKLTDPLVFEPSTP